MAGMENFARPCYVVVEVDVSMTPKRGFFIAALMRRTCVSHAQVCVRLPYLALLCWFSCLLAYASAQSGPFARSPKDWATQAAANEVSVVEFGDVYLRYRVHIVGAKGDQVRDVVESRDGTVARLIYRDNRALTSEEDAAEHERLQAMLDSPAAFGKHIKSDLNGKKLAVELVRLMPDAMLFSYTAGQPQRQHANVNHGEPAEIVLDFKPDPHWNPPTMTSEALTGLQGRLWIDPRTSHATRLEAEVFRGVNLGWGMVAHINPGGKVALEQISIPASSSRERWIFSHFVEHITLRALMVKNISEDTQIDSFDFAEIPLMSYQEAIKTLLRTPLPK